MGLLEIPAEGAPAQPLAAHHGEQRGQRSWRQSGDQALEAVSGAEERGVRGREVAVARERVGDLSVT